MVAGFESGGGARWWPASKAEGRRDGGDEYRGGGDGRLADLRRLASREDQARSGEVAARRLARRSKCRRLASREDLRSGEVTARSGEVAARSRRGQARSRRGQARASCSGGIGEQRRGAGDASCSGGEQLPFFPNFFLLP
ncbi:hypothetical protein LR48_Vigan02g034200 [Vigna angularis]|uniref:Uncharacterized protein n=1 Tax=Phaseolus angularis TaxID=3914 RepID=A0A0L9TUW1_PHAAN|nr:hypothetical protein LR48_Vigan02g034200 [Vigna angularis]